MRVKSYELRAVGGAGAYVGRGHGILTSMNDRLRNIDARSCAELIRGSHAIVALTGAGISTTAGIPDFRGPQGLYVTRRYDPDATFDIGAFHADPAPFFEFTRDFLELLDGIEPTFTHRFLAGLESQGRLMGVVTQNIDFLHQRAGSRRVVAFHGGYWESHCLGCGRAFELSRMRELVREVEVPRCSCGGVIKPDVVFFGEPVQGIEEAMTLVARSDLLLVLGSSLTVYPAAFLPEYAGGEIVVVNKGAVSLRDGPRWHWADADLDEFFGEVAEYLG